MSDALGGQHFPKSNKCLNQVIYVDVCMLTRRRLHSRLNRMSFEMLLNFRVYDQFGTKRGLVILIYRLNVKREKF